jgi:hypothetical protein
MSKAESNHYEVVVEQEDCEESILSGLLVECETCKPWRELFAQMKKLRGAVAIMANVGKTDEFGETKANPEQVWGPFTVNCWECQGTGAKLTNRGVILMGFIKTWIERAQKDWLSKTE